METGRLKKKIQQGRRKKYKQFVTENSIWWWNSTLQNTQNKSEPSIVYEFNEFFSRFVGEKFSLFRAAYIYTNLLKSSRSFTYRQVEHSLILRAAHRMNYCVC
jgi:hypothetical protein